ncbi:hemicentin-1-like [Cydia pomonella]|uniref:hemicentin-1-like n=1 Tax=Cydia pomonella TaxID=82600 RepID=UPI002ADE7AAD|nr:hemicentin-1-like [Cydia pomonella]
MAVKLLLPLAFLIAQVSCGQNSLTFVIDNSPSMDNEISQVKNAAKSIVDIVLREKASQIEDIVLVTFRNHGDQRYPSAILRKKTRDERELKQALESITLHSAYCLEVALSGIKKGLEESRQGSYLYVFTDTTSEDYNRFEEIKTLCQEKQIQVVIIITDITCGQESDEGYKVYHKIAKACSGQVFRVDKDEVNQVIEDVKETIKGDRTVVTVDTIPANTWKYVPFNIDEQTEYAVVSASGSDVLLQVYDPYSRLKTGTQITWTKNVKVTKLENLAPGTYKARVKGNSEVSIMVFGRTDFNFQHGFSTAVQTNIGATDTQPTTAVATLLMVSVQDKKHAALIREVELLDMSDQVIRRLPLTNVQGDIYKTDMFLSPEHTFKIAVVGTSKNTGSTVKRIAKTPVTPIQSVAPELSKTPTVLHVKEGASVDIPCRIIAGKPRPEISWYVKKQGTWTFIPLPNTDEVYHVAAALSNDQYKCVARNVKATDEYIVTLDLQSPPRIVFVPPNTATYSGVEGDVAMRLSCVALGFPTPTIQWEVDNKVVGRDKSKDLYVENNVLILRNPKEIHSSINSHYVCRAKNNYGEAVQPYEVTISKYIESGNANGSHYGSLDHPYDFVCPLPYTDPNSVRWFKKSTHYMNGPSLHFDHPTDIDSGNYTCRVSDMNGAVSHTVEIVFGIPPKRDRSSFSIKWSGEEWKKIACYSNESPLGEYEWLYNGKKINGAHEQSLLPIGWGQYTCQITHPLGNLVLNFQVTTKNKECGIPTLFLKAEHAPLVLDSSLTWPSVPNSGKYLMIPHSEKLQLICQDEKSSSNSFTKFPSSKSIYATCDKEDSFLVDGSPQKISELNCKNSITSSVLKTGRPCLGENTELKQVGFHINDFTDVYQSCVDTVKNVPLYTKMNTIGIKKESNGKVKTVKSTCADKCCYEKIQLVNAADVSFGPAEKATFIDSLNSVNYCKPKNNTNWHDIEEISRERADSEQFTVWSGAGNYAKVGGIWTPKYLWKVIKQSDTSEKMVVIHENTEPAGPKLCSGACGEQVVWFEPVGDRTYCCSVNDFKKALGVAIDFN